MINKTLIFFIFSVLLSIGCKHHHELSPELKLAIEVQKEAESKAAVLEKELASKTDSLNMVKSIALKEWKSQKIEIEGLDHDHSKCTHSHSRPNEVKLSDSEMLKAQQSWANALKELIEQ